MERTGRLNAIGKGTVPEFQLTAKFVHTQSTRQKTGTGG